MAFEPAQSQSNDNVSSFPSQRRGDRPMADGFLNFYLPTQGGGNRKLGTIALHTSRAAQKELVAWLNEDPSRVGIIMQKLELQYVPAEGDRRSAFDLSDTAAEPAAE